MTKIIDLPTTASTDANTFVPVYKDGKTQKVSATALGGTQRLLIDPTTGNVLATSGALGYGVGAGGTVVQTTRKTTTVTLNKPSGCITTSNSALAAGATVVFRFNNSTISADGSDVLLFTVAGYDADRYTVSASVFAPGVCSVSIKNNTASSLSEAISINFAVIKAARS